MNDPINEDKLNEFHRLYREALSAARSAKTANLRLEAANATLDAYVFELEDELDVPPGHTIDFWGSGGIVPRREASKRDE